MRYSQNTPVRRKNKAMKKAIKKALFIPQNILDERAIAYASDKEEENRSEWSKDESLLFHLGNQQFSVGLNELDEITSIGSGSILPHSDSRVIGLMNLRAEILLLVNTAQLVGLESNMAIDAQNNSQNNSQNKKRKKQILVFKDSRNQRTGFLIDGIEKALAFEDDFFEEKPAGKNGDSDIIDAIGELDGKNISRINVQKMLEGVENII